MGRIAWKCGGTLCCEITGSETEKSAWLIVNSHVYHVIMYNQISNSIPSLSCSQWEHRGSTPSNSVIYWDPSAYYIYIKSNTLSHELVYYFLVHLITYSPCDHILTTSEQVWLSSRGSGEVGLPRGTLLYGSLCTELYSNEEYGLVPIVRVIVH